MPDATAVTFLRWDAASALGADVAVTTRRGGVSEQPYDTLNLALGVGDRHDRVAVNRARAADAFGTELGAMVFAHQVHGTTVAHVGCADGGRGAQSDHDAVAGTDILVTTTPGVTLVILVADCVPLALVDPEARVLATAHAGWRGTAGGAAAAALGAMGAHGARVDRVRAFLGPAVHPDHYQVGDEVHGALAGAAAPGGLDQDVARPDGPGHWLVDLVAANRRELARHGVAPEHITDSGATTADDAFFSHRAHRPCGRFALLARLTG